jgi:hypothetical protein
MEDARAKYKAAMEGIKSSKVTARKVTLTSACSIQPWIQTEALKVTSSMLMQAGFDALAQLLESPLVLQLLDYTTLTTNQTDVLKCMFTCW